MSSCNATQCKSIYSTAIHAVLRQRDQHCSIARLKPLGLTLCDGHPGMSSTAHAMFGSLAQSLLPKHAQSSDFCFRWPLRPVKACMLTLPIPPLSLPRHPISWTTAATSFCTSYTLGYCSPRLLGIESWSDAAWGDHARTGLYSRLLNSRIIGGVMLLQLRDDWLHNLAETIFLPARKPCYLGFEIQEQLASTCTNQSQDQK